VLGAHGTHVAGSNHYIGAACDIQTGWNRGPEFVYHMGEIVKKAGLYSGCSVEARSETSLSDLSAVHAPASHYE
jgi:hypothetical protein